MKGFRTPRHQQFAYKPRHWDPAEDELAERLQRIEDMKQGGIEGTKARISGNLRRSYKGNETYRRKLIMRSNIVLLGIIALLVLACVFFFQYFIPQLETFMGK